MGNREIVGGLLLGAMAVGAAGMTQVASVVFPGHETLIFWLSACLVGFSLLGMAILLIWPRTERDKPGISVKMGDRNKVGRIGNDYDR